jgi:SAM-dependent methyltransferase
MGIMDNRTSTAVSQTGYRRLPPGEEDFRYDLQTILAKPFHMDARRVIDRFLRYERVLQVKSAWTPLDFDGKRVLEIGCGPLLGAGPIAVYLGAAEYVCIEPRYQPDVLESDVLQTRFFLPFYQQLDALFNRGLSFREFVHRIRSRIRPEAVKIEDYKHDGERMDIVFSNGVLNHVGDIDRAIDMIRQQSHASTRQFHVVNFTDHVSAPDDPFRHIYRLDPSAYFEQDSLLNLKRPSEIGSLFRKAGIPVTKVPYISDTSAIPGEIAPYWSRFDASDLAVQIAFFVNDTTSPLHFLRRGHTRAIALQRRMAENSNLFQLELGNQWKMVRWIGTIAAIVTLIMVVNDG